MMKKLIMSMLVAAPMLVASSAWAATPQQALSSRLDKVNAFSANFTQKVTSPDGEVLVNGTGDLSIKRPNLFRWKTKTPDESLLVSDGKTVWYYSPFVEQVTAMWLKDATEQTPFVLLTRNSASDWSKYNVAQLVDTFTLTPKDKTSSMDKFVVTVSKAGDVRNFSVVETDGQRSQYVLSDFKRTIPAASLFTFTPPKGVELDDQRN
ncbi:outer membrane lipoprotein chaperone LolA [Photobacterium carnosum]|uniref:Outer-membrane lipoprotein carrier protein n=1 Tax=Photobacterium carnosum TaxID=2023717 RepID=A0A2N4UT26_9GAMM|nr:outer membrane lipoprotein chaperone LolA [Photobacterium carnosum]KAE8178082.1 outer membrane lipoprotein carrier protein LolA [Photobacterium carnosum]MCD9525894.1 outer membrane lipoprotein chaperone LolA [Photobacterium carnosum]MCD9535998.1 outer membrane lipoprotein chaperone LolA [Photobacterium carnosum]MCD9540863.1 outer membrane lipoprotein chaperone LolA [Photobacterium carnosum]MCD9556096.1 outer membrane lipoprotein chaperone LolA [Photobacterium carnosum]